MYEDLKNNAKRILSNEVINTLIGARTIADDTPFESSTSEDNPLIDLHTVIDADSTKDEQITVYDKILYRKCTPSHAQAIQMKRLSKHGILTSSVISTIT